MNKSFNVLCAGVAALALMALGGCGSDNKDTADKNAAPKNEVTCPEGSITGAGSSAQKNAMEAWVKSYQSTCTKSKINYQGVGSGAGIQQFIDGSVDFAGTDSPLKPEEQSKANTRCKGKAIHLPMVTGPIAVVFNLDGVENLQLPPATIAKIFSGAIKTWDDPLIKASNQNVSFPSIPVRAVHRSDSSGTTDNFTAYLTAAAKKDWIYGAGKQWKAPGGEAGNKSDGIVAAVSKNEGAISYVDLSVANNSDLSKAKVGVPNGKFVEPNDNTASKAAAVAQITGQANDLRLSINYTPEDDASYPIILVTYEVTCETHTDAKKGLLVKDFFLYTASAAGQNRLPELGFAPLPFVLAPSVRESVKTIK